VPFTYKFKPQILLFRHSILMDHQSKEIESNEFLKKKEKLTFSTILKEIADFKGWEIIFQVLLYGFLCWGIYALYVVYQFHHDPVWADIPKFSIYDFKMAVIPTFIFFLYKNVCIKLFYGWTKKNLDVKYTSDEDRSQRALKGAIWVSNIIYYSFSSILSVYLFKDAFFFPTYLGGSAQCGDIYKYTPYVPEIPYAVLFYQIQFGWHFHTLIDHVVYKWRDPKFWEMFLHHSVAVFLIFFSYLSNQVPVGILVLVTHDPSDIGLCGSRYYNDLKGKSKSILAGIYLSFVLSWMYLRLFVFPKCVVGQSFVSLWNYPKDSMYSVYLYMIFMMSALVILHIYWFTYIMRILMGLVTTKKEYNLYDKKK